MNNGGKIVPRVGSNGISLEYKLAFGPVEHYIRQVERYKGNELGPRYLFMAARTLAQRPILHYEEFFDPQLYKQPVTEQNKEKIVKLNSIVDELNVLCMGENAAQILRHHESEQSRRVVALYSGALDIIEGRINSLKTS